MIAALPDASAIATPAAIANRWDTLGRVAWRLLELGERFGDETPDGISVELPLSQEQLAG